MSIAVISIIFLYFQFRCTDGLSTSKAYIVGGSLVSVYSSNVIPDQLKMDFVESTFYAQYNASQKFNREENGMKWYEEYIQILKHVGWNITYSPWRVETKNMTTWKSMIENGFYHKLNWHLQECLNDAIISYLRLPASSTGVKIFNQMSTMGDMSTFQIIPALVTDVKNLMANFGLFSVIQIESTDTSAQQTSVLFSTRVGTLDSAIYDKYRNGIKKYIQNTITDYIFSL